MIAGLLAFAPATSSAAVLLSDGFEGVPGRSVLEAPYVAPSATSWSTAGDAAGVAVYTRESLLPVYEGDQALRLLGVSGAALTGNFSPQTGGTIVISYQLYVPSTQTASRIINFATRSNASSNNGAYLVLWTNNAGTNSGLGYFDRTNAYHKLASTVYDRWTSLALEINLDTSRYAIRYDGTLYDGTAHAGIEFYRNVSNLASFHAITSANGLVYFDNFSVQPIPEASSLLLLGAGSLLMTLTPMRRRRKI